MTEPGFLELITTMCLDGHEDDAAWFADQVRQAPCRWIVTASALSELVTCSQRGAAELATAFAVEARCDATARNERGEWFTMSAAGVLVERGWGVAL